MASVDIWLTLIQVGAVAVAAAAVIVTLSGIKRQLWLATFSDYTRRYSEITERVPIEARLSPDTFGLDTIQGPERDRLLGVAICYFNLCSEEFHLRQTKIIDEKTWLIWETEMRSAFQRRWLREAWVLIDREYDSFTEFHEFVCATLSNSTGDSARARAA
jgi:hypothetical protein